MEDEPKKYDQGKPPVSLIPFEYLEGLALALKHGADKYEKYNWARGFNWSRLISASYRHLGAFESGEDLDKESGLSHILHLGCCALFLYMHTKLSLGKDDRWVRPVPGGFPLEDNEEDE